MLFFNSLFISLSILNHNIPRPQLKEQIDLENNNNHSNNFSLPPPVQYYNSAINAPKNSQISEIIKFNSLKDSISDNVKLDDNVPVDEILNITVNRYFSDEFQIILDNTKNDLLISKIFKSFDHKQSNLQLRKNQSENKKNLKDYENNNADQSNFYICNML